MTNIWANPALMLPNISATTVIGNGVDDTSAIQEAVDGYDLVFLQGPVHMGRISITDSISLIPIGKCVIHLVGTTSGGGDPGAGFIWDSSFDYFHIGAFEIIGSGVEADNQYGYGPSVSTHIVTNVINECCQIEAVCVGFEHSSAQKFTLLCPRVLSTLGDTSGHGYAISCGGNGAIAGQDGIMISPYIANATRHSIYIGFCKRVTISNPVIYRHRFGLPLDLNLTALTMDRLDSVTVTNPMFNQCNGCHIDMADDDEQPTSTGTARDYKVFGGQIIDPQSGSIMARIGTGTPPSADINLSRVTIDGLKCMLSDITGTAADGTDSDFYITYGVDVTLKNIEVYGQPAGYIAERTSVVIAGDTGASAFNGPVKLLNWSGRISSSTFVNFCRPGDTIVAGTRSVVIKRIDIEGMSNDATHGLLTTGIVVTNPNLVTDSTQEFNLTGITPYVSYGTNFTVTHPGPSPMTDFLGVKNEGKSIHLRFGDDNTTLGVGATIGLKDGVDFNPTGETYMVFRRRDGKWQEESRSINHT